MVAACGGDNGGDDVGSDADVGADSDAGGDGGGTDADLDVADTESDTPPDVSVEVDSGQDEEDIGGDPTEPLSCGSESIEFDFTPGAAVEGELEVEGSRSGGVVVRFLGRESASAATLTVSCFGDEIAAEGTIALSPAWTLESTGVPRFSRRYFVTMPFDRTLLPENARPSSIRLFFRHPDGRVVEPVVTNFQENMVRGTVRFETELTGTFQLAVRADAGQPRDREWQFRAITGVSMGGLGSSMIAARHPAAFDFVAPLGGPAEWVYLARYIREGGMGGFNPAPEFGNSAEFTPTQEGEHSMAFDNWYYPTGEGTGGTFDRGSYSDIFQDLMMAVGNIVTYNPESPYRATGLPIDEVRRAPDSRCPTVNTCPPEPGATFTIANGFYDDEYNPDGSLPVIAFCDGQGSNDRTVPFDRACDNDFNGVPDETNRGWYQDACAQRRPFDVTLAVDVNGNGIRDPGEPVIRNFYEPYDDFGSDGIPSHLEEGYDPITNPDPAGDDYDFVSNPFGTEGNWLWDEGEPFRDFGLDGVEGTPQFDEGGFDFGEGNGQFDYNPNLARVFEEFSPRHLLMQMSEEDRLDLNFYVDAGIRDLFNFAVGANQLAGTIQGLGGNLRLYEDFFRVQDLDPDDSSAYNFTLVDYENLGDNVYVRYGDIDADDEDVCFGDGKHVGTIPQLANRLLTMLGFATNRFPDGERTPIPSPFPLASGTYFTPSPSLGGMIRYSIALPPGYEWTQCSDGRDNNANGLRDGANPHCTSAVAMSEDGESITLCTDGIDNDADGLIDDADPDCVNGDGLSEWPVGSPFRDARFPVVYIMHGYGMAPDELQIAALPFSGFMANGVWPKVIIVFPDGYCGEDEVTACNDGIDNDGDGLIDGADPGCAESGGRSESGVSVSFCSDGVDNDRDGLIDLDDGGCLHPDWDTEADCIQGSFYTDHVSYRDGIPGGPAFEAAFFDLVAHIDSTYRVREPEVFPEFR